MNIPSVQRLFDIPKFQKEATPLKKAFNTKKDGHWHAISSDEFVADIDTVSSSLLAMGLKAGDKIAVITTGNRYEWHVLDFAMMQIGVINVPFYDTISSREFAKLLQHSEARFCFVSDQVLFDKISALKSETMLEDILFLTNVGREKSWENFTKLGIGQDFSEEIKRRKDVIKPDDLATIMYTSGTTGDPKGVMLSHKNFLTCIDWAVENLVLEGPTVKVLSYLPIAHMFERFTTYYYMKKGFEIYFAESIEKLAENMQEVRPNFIPIVPRLLEKIYDKIIAKGLALKGVKKSLFFWAIKQAENWDFYDKGSALFRLKMKIADKLIFSKWREVFGGEIQFMVSGSAPLQARLIRLFSAAGLPIYEGYGMTELSPLISLNELQNKGIKFGSVGRPISIVDVKIAEDGEILVKGDNLFMGYYKNPEATASSFTDAYFHTGDIGTLDDNRILTITDRKKQIFKTSSGKYVAPAHIENTLRESSFIEQVMVVGENRRMLTALIDINEEFVRAWELEHGHNSDDLRSDPVLKARIQEEIDHYNKQFGKWETIKRFSITPEPWSVEGGHMTPTLKVKRKFLLETYSDLVEKMYE